MVQISKLSTYDERAAYNSRKFCTETGDQVNSNRNGLTHCIILHFSSKKSPKEATLLNKCLGGSPLSVYLLALFFRRKQITYRTEPKHENLTLFLYQGIACLDLARVLPSKKSCWKIKSLQVLEKWHPCLKKPTNPDKPLLKVLQCAELQTEHSCTHMQGVRCRRWTELSFWNCGLRIKGPLLSRQGAIPWTQMNGKE